MDNTCTPLTIAQKTKKIAQHTAVLFSVGNIPIYAEAFEVLNVSHEAVIGLTASVVAAEIELLSTKPHVASEFLMFSAGYYFLKNDLNPAFLADAQRAFQSAPRVNF